MAFESFFRQAIRKLSREHTQKSRTRKLRFDDLAERINPATGTVAFLNLNDTVTEGATGDVARISVRLVTDNVSMNNDLLVKIRDISPGGVGWATPQLTPVVVPADWVDPNDYVRPDPSAMTTSNTPQPNTINFNTASGYVVFRTNQQPIAVVNNNLVYEQILEIPLNNDRRIESDETFRLELGLLAGDIVSGTFNNNGTAGTTTDDFFIPVPSPTDAISKGGTFQSTVTIDDNDTATVTFAGPTTAVEGGGTGAIAATLSFTTPGAGPQALDIDVAATIQNSADYTASTVTWMAGSAPSTQNITITALDDWLVEANLENHTGVPVVTPTPASGSVAIAGTAPITIDDNDSATLALTTPGATSLNESGSTPLATRTLGVTLTLNTQGNLPTTGNPVGLAVPITATLPGNGDYTATTYTFNPQTVTTVGSGMLAARNDNLTSGASGIVIQATDDQLVEDYNEVYNTQLLQEGVPNNTADVTYTTDQDITIVDDNDTATFSITNGTTTVTEGGLSQNVVVTMTLTTTGTGTQALAIPVTVDFIENGDYTTAAANFAANSNTGTTSNIVVAAVNDTAIELKDETQTTQNLEIITPNTVPTRGPVGQHIVASGNQTVVVKDNDSAVVNIVTPGTTTIAEGATANVQVQLRLIGNGVLGAGTLDVPITVGFAPTSSGVPTATSYDFNSSTTASPLFPAGSPDMDLDDVVVSALDDLLLEGTETFNNQPLVLPSATVNVSSGTTQNIVITDTDTATITITAVGANTAVTEGAPSPTNMQVTLTTAGGVTLAVPISVKLQDNSDYSTTVATFATGAGNAATADVPVSAVNDWFVEPQETFAGQTLVFDPSTDPTIVSAVTLSGTRTIVVNDNETANIAIGTGSTTLTEGAAPQNVTATLTITGSGTGTKQLQLAGGSIQANLNIGSDNDYTSAFANFADGSNDGTTANVVLDDVDDRLVESATETFGPRNLEITNNGGATATATGSRTINVNDNDTATVNIFPSGGTYALTEGQAGLPVQVQLALSTTGSGPSELAVPVTASFAGNADYSTQTAATFSPGVPAERVDGATKNVTIIATDDRLVEAVLETFTNQTLSLSSTATPPPTFLPTSAGSITVTVAENDSANVSIPAAPTINKVTLTEGGTNQTFPVTITLNTTGVGLPSTALLDVPVVVTLTPGDNDFTVSGNATFGLGAASGSTANLTLAAVDDNSVEASPELAVGGPQSLLLVPNANPVPGNGNITVSGTSGKLIVEVNDNDYARLTYDGVVTVAEGNSTPSIVTAKIEYIVAPTGTGPTQLDVVVQAKVISASNDFTSNTAQWNPGEAASTKNIEITAFDDKFLEAASETADGVLQPITEAQVQVLGSVTVTTTDTTEKGVVEIPAGPTAVTEGGPTQNIAATLKLTSASGEGTLATEVPVTANIPNNSDFTTTAATFESGWIPANGTRNIVVSAVNDEIVEPSPESFSGLGLTVSGTTNATPDGTLNTHTVNVTDNDEAVFTISNATITEGGTLAFTVSLAKAIQHTENIDVRVNFATGGPNGNALLSDFTSTSVDLAFLPGVANQSFTVNVATNGDDIVEALETFTASLQLLESLPTHNINVSDTGTGTITDDDTAIFTIDDVTVTEGTAISFAVNTSKPLDIDINIGVSYTDQTATGGADYDSAPDTAPFTFNSLGAGATTINVTVGTFNDNIVEAVEKFMASMSTNTLLGGRSVVFSDTAIGTINDNDNAIFNIDDVTINEGGNTATFTVSTTNPIDIDVAIDVSYAGTGSNPATGGNVDFDSLTDSVTFSALSTANRTVTVAIVNDNIVETTETFLASLGTTTSLGGRAITTTDTGLGTIQDNDTAIFTVGDVTVTEGGTINFAVTLDKEIDTPVGIDVGYAGGNATGGGADYDSGTDLANFAANVAGPQTINVSVATNNDNIVEAIETFIASLTVNSGTNLGGRAVNVSDQATGTITDNDTAIFTINDVTVTEGGTINFAVTLDKEIDIPVSVNVNYGGGNATGGNTDYDSGVDPANFLADTTGPQTIQVSVATNDDNIVEAIETFIASLSTSTALGGRLVNLADTGTGTINDNDTAIFTIDDATANESAGTMTFTISVSNPIDIPVAIDIGYTGAPTVPFTALGAGVDFDSTGGTTATFLANSVVPRQVTVAITNDNVVEATETFRAALTSPTVLGGRSLNLADTATGTIIDNDVATFLIDSPTVNESAGTLTFTVSVDNPIDIPVTITSTYTNQTATGGGTDFTSTNGSATFVANVTAPQSITVPINNDNIVEATETFLASISTSTPLGSRSVVTTDTGVGTIQDNDTAIISIDDVTVNEADGTATFSIISDKQIDIPLSVSVNYGGGTATGGLDYDSATDTGNLGALSTGPVTVSVNIFNDTLSEATETFIASLSTSTALGGRSVTLSDTGTGTITDNDTATFTISDVTVNESAGTATLTLAVTNPLDIDVAIDVNYAGGTAIGGTDYDNATDSVTFVANSTANRTVTVALTNDNIVEATETFIASLSSPTNLGGRVINVADTATATLQDNDTATFTIDDVVVEEGGLATFTVNLSNPIDTNVTVNVNYAGTGANPATAGGIDFDSTTDSVTFNAGTTAPQTVTVQTTAEALNETIETFLATLSTTTPLGDRSVSLTDTGLGTIIDHNEAPVLTVPQAAFTFQVNTPLTIQGVTANDTEIALQAPNAQALQVTIAVDNGDVTLATTAGLTFVTGDGTNNATMTFTGNIASVNAALASLTYRPTADTLVPDTMKITVSDLGTLGAGGVMTDYKEIALNTLSNLVQSQPSPLTPTVNDIVVYGTTGNDNILVQYGSRGFVITVNGVRSQPFGGAKGRVVVFGSDGNDTITVASTISRGTYLDGGNGNDSLRGGKGRDTLTGGQGTDTLNGGAGFDQLYEKADANFTLVGGTRTTDGSLTTVAGVVTETDVLVRNYIESAFLVGGDGANTINTTAFAGPVTLMGGAGDDILSSGRHHDVLVGGAGLDTMNGGDGKDLLIGGAGLDNLTGGNHDDILVGSSTSFDTDAIALSRIRNEWIRTDVSLHLRINHINGLAPRGGKNGTTRLNSSSVFNDTTNDVFTGGAGNDYFVNFLGEPVADFAGLDRQANITIIP